MPNPEEQPIPAPQEATPQPENNTEVIKRLATPETSRIVAGAINKKFLNPEEKVPQEDQEGFKSWVAHKNPEEINYKAVEALSVDSRREYWENNEGDFEAQKKEWTEGVSKWIKHATGENAEKRDEVIDTLKSVGIENVGEEQLSDEIEKYREKYLDEKSDIKQFVSDIADKCKDNEGNVDLGKLETRLDAVKGLLSTFGQTNEIPALVKDYTTAHGLLSQKEETKKTVADEVYNKTKDLMPEDAPEKTRLKKIYEKQQELNTPSQTAETPSKEEEPTEQQEPEPSTPTEETPQHPTEEQLETTPEQSTPKENTTETKTETSEKVDDKPTEPDQESKQDQAQQSEDPQTEDSSEKKLQEGQRLLYMDLPGKIVEVRGGNAKVELDNGHNLTVSVEDLLKEGGRFELQNANINTPDQNSK